MSLVPDVTPASPTLPGIRTRRISAVVHATLLFAMTLPPQVEKMIEKIDAFMLKYPQVSQYGAFSQGSRVQLQLRKRGTFT